ncbi:MAG: hypothetical protein NXY57DRAFT_960726 [Lentinula lateritia]|uniref:Uncharacterized protein n=1 Tax=Lentinula aff. lateritia TaxID=2804960 RepID=A0ACC1TTQ9_9AGAR|nr:hypothetical protein F5876DRAFT_79011 [Lentinula aff. lateritia]KAJ3849188.1 hypothetical protein EV368DRAFT_85788 [Lentinula lateritia]KAJ3932587.1 MAG: hypothetical protein NXY57DRAFT_960726 [Lentinula lateritia]
MSAHTATLCSSTAMTNAYAMPSDFSLTPPTIDKGTFAFARIHGEICLVQVSSSTPAQSALATVDVKIFRHEFITIFRLSTTTTLHPSDIQIMENIDEKLVYHEEENGTVFLARDVMERLRKLTLPVFPISPRRVARPSSWRQSIGKS